MQHKPGVAHTYVDTQTSACGLSINCASEKLRKLMASLPATKLLLNVVICTPYVGEILQLKHDPDNLTDPSVVALIRDGEL